MRRGNQRARRRACSVRALRPVTSRCDLLAGDLRRGGCVIAAATADQQRKSPETRREPLHTLVPDPPLQVSDEYAEQFRQAKPRKDEPADLTKRDTPLARGMVRDVPADGSWYLAAICFSPRQATALSSHISRGGYGTGVSVARGPMPNKNAHQGEREPWCVLLKKTARRGRA